MESSADTHGDIHLVHAWYDVVMAFLAAKGVRPGWHELNMDALESASAWRRGLPEDVRHLQVPGRPTDAQWKRLGGLLRERPEIGLRVYYGGKDVEYLKHLSHLREFTVDSDPDLIDISGLRYLTDVRLLHVSAGLKKLDLGPIADLRGLVELTVAGPIKSLAPIADQPDLKSLYLASVKIDPEGLLTSMPRLVALKLAWMKIDNLSFLADCPQLEYFEISSTRKVTDLSPISSLKQLRQLALEYMSGVTVIPSLRDLGQLEQIYMTRMKRLSDVGELGFAPALRRLLATDMAEQQPKMFATLTQSTSLENADVYFGSHKRNNAFRDMVKKPSIDGWNTWPEVSYAGEVTRSVYRR